MRTGIAHLPLHGGKCPPWLFEQMKKLGGAIIEVIVAEYGPEEVLRRVSDPFWFQALGCVLGFDWHSSGLTTTVCGALKEGIRGREKELGIAIAGGKGKTSRATPQEIVHVLSLWGAPGKVGETLVYASKMAAKVDNNALQDGYQLYHHAFFFTSRGSWGVVQQGMHRDRPWARRYHWLGEKLPSFTNEPHKAVCGKKEEKILNLVAQESAKAREAITHLAGEKPEKVLYAFEKIASSQEKAVLNLPAAHAIPRAEYLKNILPRLYARQPQDFEELLGTEGVGEKTLRALALVAEVAYGARPSFRDPVRYSFAHGGKDGHPYPLDRETYLQSVAVLEKAISEAKLGRGERLAAFKRLASFLGR